MKAIRIFFDNDTTWIVTENEIYFSNSSYILKRNNNLELLVDICKKDETYFEQIF